MQETWSTDMKQANIKRRAIITGLSATYMGLCVARADTPSFNGHANSTSLRNQAWDSIQVIDADGESLRIQNNTQGLVFVNLWANWCAGCIEEMSSLTRMATLLGPSLRVVLVSHPSNWANDRIFARKHALSLPLYAFPPDTPDWVLASAYDSLPGSSYSVPQSLLFSSSSGELVWSEQGSLDWSAPEQIQKINSFL